MNDVPARRSHPSWQDAAEREWIPDFRGWFARTMLGTARLGVKGLLGNLKPSPLPGRDQMMRSLARATIEAAPVMQVLPEPGRFDVRLKVHEAFGKPLLVNFDMLIPVPRGALTVYSREEQAVVRSLLADVMDRVVETVWDNPIVAPVAIRGRTLVQREEGGDASDGDGRNGSDVRGDEVAVLDMRDLGFSDEIARVEDLYQRFGSPAGDPDFRP